MKHIYLTFLSFVFVQVTDAQIKEYFVPSYTYFNQVFQFETEKWENENGQFQTKNRVKYYNDPSGNFKKYIESTSYRYNVPEVPLKVH